MHLSIESQHTKEYLSEAPFGFERNGAFISQGSGRTVVIKKVHISDEKRWNIMGVCQIKVKIEFLRQPAIQSLYNGIGVSPRDTERSML